MKVWMISVSYVPLVINAAVTAIVSPEEFRWAGSVNMIGAIGILVAMIMLKLMTWKDTHASVQPLTSCSKSIASSCDCSSAADSRQVPGEMLTSMPLQWAKG
jgi:hypothetical protein